MPENINPDEYTHGFVTYMGLPPSVKDKPVCGSVLTDDFAFDKPKKGNCPRCEKWLAHRLAIHNN